MFTPIESQPGHAIADRVDIFLRFLLRIGIVEAQVTHAVIIMRNAEIQTNALGMANVQITVRFRRKTRFHPPAPFAGAIIVIDNVANEIGRCYFGSGMGFGFLVQSSSLASGNDASFLIIICFDPFDLLEAA